LAACRARSDRVAGAMTFDTILIIGCGLIGSSIARAAKSYEQAKTVYVSDQSESVCTVVETLGFAETLRPQLYRP